MNERRAFSLTAVFHRAFEGLVRFKRIGAVAFLDVKIRKTRNELRDVTTRGSDLDRDADRIAIVLDHENDRQLQVTSRVESFPPFALARGAVADWHVDDLIALK